MFGSIGAKIKLRVIWGPNIVVIQYPSPLSNIGFTALFSVCDFHCPHFAGHFIPQLAELIFDRNKDRSKYPFINLKGFIVSKAYYQ